MVVVCFGGIEIEYDMIFDVYSAGQSFTKNSINK